MTVFDFGAARHGPESGERINGMWRRVGCAWRWSRYFSVNPQSMTKRRSSLIAQPAEVAPSAIGPSWGSPPMKLSCRRPSRVA